MDNVLSSIVVVFAAKFAELGALLDGYSQINPKISEKVVNSSIQTIGSILKSIYDEKLGPDSQQRFLETIKVFTQSSPQLENSAKTVLNMMGGTRKPNGNAVVQYRPAPRSRSAARQPRQNIVVPYNQGRFALQQPITTVAVPTTGLFGRQGVANKSVMNLTSTNVKSLQIQELMGQYSMEVNSERRLALLSEIQILQKNSETTKLAINVLDRTVGKKYAFVLGPMLGHCAYLLLASVKEAPASVVGAATGTVASGLVVVKDASVSFLNGLTSLISFGHINEVITPGGSTATNVGKQAAKNMTNAISEVLGASVTNSASDKIWYVCLLLGTLVMFILLYWFQSMREVGVLSVVAKHGNNTRRNRPQLAPPVQQLFIANRGSAGRSRSRTGRGPRVPLGTQGAFVEEAE